jgi:hypothetical protein
MSTAVLLQCGSHEKRSEESVLLGFHDATRTVHRTCAAAVSEILALKKFLIRKGN